MQAVTRPQDAPAACPMHAVRKPSADVDVDAAGALPVVARTDELVLPMQRGFAAQYVTTATGDRELRLFRGDREIAFDEPELFGFGETLVRTGRFVAADAVAWGAGLDWPRVRVLLGDLLAAGILRRATDPDEAPAVADGDRASPLAPARTTVAHEWTDSEAILDALAGRPVEPGWLESVVPIFRVAHMALDADGRQIGESNAFPPALRLDVPTRWRTCIYAGTRHRAEQPMNVSALKAMRAHWQEMMAVLLAMRAAYLARFPEAAAGWTVGHLERLSTCVLALPSLVVLRRDVPFANGTLHPALSSVFRVTDGLRMTLHRMLFVPFGEPTRTPDDPVTAAQVLDYAERNFAFHSEHGVCAGPQAMIEEFLAVIVDGRMPRDGLPALLDEDVEATLAVRERAIDYGLLGLQVYAAIYSLWPAMTRTYETLALVVHEWAAAGNAAAAAFAARLDSHLADIERAGFLAKEQWRADRDHVYADMHAQCGRGLDRDAPAVSLATQLLPRVTDADMRPLGVLRAALARHFGVGTDARPLDVQRLEAVHGCIAGFLLKARAVLAAAAPAQARINVLLVRTPPRRPLVARDLDLHRLLAEGRERRMPFLFDELHAVFGVRAEVDATTLVVTTDPVAVPHATHVDTPHPTDIPSAGPRATFARFHGAIHASINGASNAPANPGEPP